MKIKTLRFFRGGVKNPATKPYATTKKHCKTLVLLALLLCSAGFMKSFAQDAPTFYHVRPGMNEAELSWSQGTATATAWQVKYATTTGDPTNEQYGTSITVYEPNTTLTGLEPFTTYYVYVRSGNNGGWSNVYSNVYTFKTLATSFAITDDTPYIENFDNTQAFDWVFLSRQTNPLNSTNGTYASYNNHWVHGSGTYNSYSRSLYISYLNNTVYRQDGYYIGYDYAVKMVTLEGGKNYEVSFDWKSYPCLPNYNYYNPDYRDYFRVMLVPSSIHLDPYVNSKPSDLKDDRLPEGWIALDGGFCLMSSDVKWRNERVTIPIPEGQGGDYQVVFFWYSRSQDGHVISYTPSAVDNLMINTFYGNAPTELTATSDTRSAQLSWTENGSATAWEVMYFTGENSDPYTNEGTIVEANTNPIQLTGLTPETHYYAYVRACYSVDGETKHTRWSSLCDFTTDISCYPVENLVATNLTQTEATVTWEPGDEEEAWIVRFRNADGIPTTNGFDNGQLPQGWTGLRYEYDEATYDETYVVDNTVWSFDGDDPINGTYSLTTSEEACLMIPLQSATTQAKFSVKGVDDGEVYTRVEAGVYTGDISAFDWGALDYYMEVGSVPTTSTQYMVDLSEAPGNCYFYIIVAPSSGGGGPKNRSFKATIDDIVIYATDEWSEETVSNPMHTFTGLDEATRYEVQVMAHCDEGDDSQLRSLVFTTPLCPPEDQCSISYTLEDSYGDGWSGNAIQVVDVQTGVVLDTWTMTSEDGQSASGTLAVCNGREVLFRWVSGSWASECSFSITYFDESGVQTYDGSGSDLYDGQQFLSFTLVCPSENVFNGENGSNWSTAANWSKGNVPNSAQIAVIDANCSLDTDATVVELRVSEGKTLTIQSGKTLIANEVYTTAASQLVIKDGGQLYHTNSGVQATVEKDIQAYTAGETNGRTDGWYLITPAATNTTIENGDDDFSIQLPAISTDDVIGLKQGNYDLYRFVQSEEGAEWRNFKNTDNNAYDLNGLTFPFQNFYPGEGYLYANSADVTLQFEGTLMTLEEAQNLFDDGFGLPMLQYDDESTFAFAGWNLIGNPLVRDVYLIATAYDWGWVDVGPQDYYRMNVDGSELTLCDDGAAVHPMEGVFVEWNDYNSYIRFSAEPYNNNSGGYDPKGSIGFSLKKDCGAKGATTLDRAKVRFGEGPTLGKFMLNADNTHISIPQGDKEYAVARSAAQGEMPIKFKASENGSYTLSIDVENVEMDYLHLIDNKTGADVDLLATPNYTFDARTTDYSSRFRLVFSANQGDSPSTGSEPFAYYNGSEWVVSNEGRATLQVIDMLGRVLSSETIAGNATIRIEQPAGVYLMRLVNNNDVKTQKVVVR